MKQKILLSLTFTIAFIQTSVLSQEIVIENIEKQPTVSIVSDSISTEHDQNKLTYLLEHAIDPKLITDSIPTFFLNSLIITEPETNIVTIKDALSVKGQNKYGSEVLVNNKTVRLQSDGKFFSEIKIKEKGKQSFYITFFTPDNKFIIVKRNIVKLFMPKDIQSVYENRQDYIYFYNTPFTHDEMKQKKLKEQLTRADLAFFITTLLDEPINLPDKKKIKDISQEFWAYQQIQFVVQNGIMAEFPDGNFNPTAPISKLEYILSMIRAFGYDPEIELSEFPFKDVNPLHWTAKYIKTALRKKIITPDSQFQGEKLLTFAEFIDLAKNIPAVQVTYTSLKNFDSGFETVSIEKDEMLNTVYEKLLEKEKELASLKQLIIDTPKPREIVFSPEKTIKGTIYPPTPFKINNTFITPNHQGVFNHIVALDVGKNTITINALEQTKNITLFYLNSFDDLENHWVKETAAKLRYINQIEDTEKFEPKRLITKGELAHYLTILIKEKTTSENIMIQNKKNDEAKDVTETNPYYSDISLIISKNIMSLDANQKFHPKQPVKRAEAITAIVRSFNLDKSNQNERSFPFWDVKKTHWARNYVEAAYNNKLISKRNNFYPKKRITKAEIFAIIAKLPLVQEKLEQTFNH